MLKIFKKCPYCNKSAGISLVPPFSLGFAEIVKCKQCQKKSRISLTSQITIKMFVVFPFFVAFIYLSNYYKIPFYKYAWIILFCMIILMRISILLFAPLEKLDGQ